MKIKEKNYDNQEHVVYIPIDSDSDRQYWKSYGYQIRTIKLGSVSRLYVIYFAKNEEERKSLQNLYDAELKRESRYKEKFNGGCASYDELLENGYDAMQTDNSTEDEALSKLLEDNVEEIVSSLSEENQRLYHMLVNGELEKEVAKELGIPVTTLNYRKKKLRETLKTAIDNLV